MPAPQACCAEAVIPSRTCPQRVEAEEVDEAADVPGQRSEAILLPARDCLRPDAEDSSMGPLRRPQIQPLATRLVAGRVDRKRVPPWQNSRPAVLQLQAGKGQRNGARAFGEGIPSVGAGAHLMLLRVAPLVSEVPSCHARARNRRRCRGPWRGEGAAGASVSTRGAHNCGARGPCGPGCPVAQRSAAVPSL